MKPTGAILCSFIVSQQVLRDNALELFPKLQDGLWKHKGWLQPLEK